MMHNRIERICKKGLLAANVPKQESSLLVVVRADGLDHERSGPSAQSVNGKNESNTVF